MAGAAIITASYVPPVISLRPVVRPDAFVASPAKPAAVKDTGFRNWIKGFRVRALRAGISGRTFDQAFQGVQFDPKIIKRDRNQSEFTKTIGEYLASAASETRIKNGKAALRKHKRKLDAIEAKYGVDKEVVVAVWGMESAYGNYRGDTPIIEALATLAYDGRRGKFFEAQLIAALKILQNGDTTPRNMTGSWAGAMGHTQFIPTSYLAFAVDFTGDGKRDIWSDDPSDALASTAAYLAKSGWKSGVPWGVEVTLPKGFSYSHSGRHIKKKPSVWSKLGVKGVNGRAVPDYGEASLMLPAGANGVAFLIFRNFRAIERYNAADAYVIGVGHLSDRLKGKPAFSAKWPDGDRGLKRAERKELQILLARKGYNVGPADGKIGAKTLAAVRAYQAANGLIADGYVSHTLLRKLR
jgi:membrane-bound lytic murein transglycosylase B